MVGQRRFGRFAAASPCAGSTGGSKGEADRPELFPRHRTAGAVSTCFAEIFQETRTIERSRNRPWLAGFELGRDVSLLDLTGTWPTKAGASMAINSGRRDRARAWSLRVYEDYPTIEGLYYPSSMDGNQPSVALHERAQEAIPARPLFDRALEDPALNSAVVKSALLFNYGVDA